MAAAVSGIYWTLILLAPHLILPPAVNQPQDSLSPLNLAWLPLYIDILIHLLPAIFLVIDFYLLEAKYSNTDVKVFAPGMLVAFTVWYSGWVEYLNLYNHRCKPSSLSHSLCEVRGQMLIDSHSNFRNSPLPIPKRSLQVPCSHLHRSSLFRIHGLPPTQFYASRTAYTTQ